MANDRIFYACQGVLVRERNTQAGSDAAGGTFLTGVQSIGVSSEFPSESLMDVGRAQKQFHFYGQQSFQITIERVIDTGSDFFYHVDPSDYTDYENSHILHANNIGCQGELDSDGKALRNYDITILYGPDDQSFVSGAVDVVTYRNCLINSISYNIGTEAAVTESITLSTKAASHTTGNSSSFSVPTSAQEGDLLRRTDLADLLALTGAESKLPTEVTTMFDTSTTLEGLKILGINNITIDVAIDYSELGDVGKWKGSIDQGEQNLWRYVVLPVQVSASFTGTARKAFAREMKNTDTTFSAADGSTSSKEWDKVNKQIRLVAQKAGGSFFIWDLGQSNYLTAMDISGGDTGGGNVEVTMSYQNDASDIVIVKDTSVVDLTKPTNPY